MRRFGLIPGIPEARFTSARNRKGEAARFVDDCLDSHPGSTGPEIVAAAGENGFPRATVYRQLQAGVLTGRLRSARGGFWKGRIEDPELAVDAEIERTAAILRSPRLPVAAKVEAATQLGRESSRATPRSRRVVELLHLVAKSPPPVRAAMLPFVQRALRAAAAPDEPPKPGQRTRQGSGTTASRSAAFPRKVWAAARDLLDPFLRTPDESGVMAWNAVYEAVALGNLLGDEELLALARLAVKVELGTPYSPPSPALAVLHRIALEERLRNRIAYGLLQLYGRVRTGSRKTRIRDLIRTIDLAPPRPREP